MQEFFSTKDECCASLIHETGEYLMIDKLSIENFRCFKSVQLWDLKRVNIIVGENASGKTVLLEAIKVGLDGLPGCFAMDQSNAEHLNGSPPKSDSRTVSESICRVLSSV